MRAFFDDLEPKAAFCLELFEGGRQDEALTLCCCYIDGLAHYSYGDSPQRSAFNFARILREHGEEKDLDLVSALALVRHLEEDRPKLAPLAAAIRKYMGASLGDLTTQPQLEARLTSFLPGKDMERLTPHLWRGSLAHIAYKRLRVPFVHAISGPGAVVVGTSDHRDPAGIHIDFRMLHRALVAIIRRCRELSESTGKWFGHS